MCMRVSVCVVQDDEGKTKGYLEDFCLVFLKC